MYYVHTVRLRGMRMGDRRTRAVGRDPFNQDFRKSCSLERLRIPPWLSRFLVLLVNLIRPLRRLRLTLKDLIGSLKPAMLGKVQRIYLRMLFVIGEKT